MLLYIRTCFVMLVSLYTSRIILQALGVEDYGTYQVVGGVVAMFSIISNSLSSAISRFITFEIGHGDKEKLRKIFSTSILIQIGLALIVCIAVEIVAIWFMETYMQIPDGRMTAAKWVLQCSLVTFCITLISIPYNACIIAHERMKAFAYVSIIEVLLKLGVCFCIMFLPGDRLITYAILLTVTAFIIRLVYTIYCHRNFEETRGRIIFDKTILREMIGFSGWSFFTNTNYLLNTQGVNMLINVYFGVTLNAARGIATQIEGTILRFVDSFTTAINPQITKSYAANDLSRTRTLVCRGAKFSYLAMLLFVVPLICETEMILHLWLKDVPAYTVAFTRLSLVLGLIDCLGKSGYTAGMASGRIRKYALVLTPIGFLEFPLVWLFFSFGADVLWAYYLYVLIKIVVVVVRAHLLEEFIGLKLRTFFQKVLMPVTFTTLIAFVPTVVIVYLMPSSIIRLFASLLIGVLSTAIVSFYVGMTPREREVIKLKLKQILSKWEKRT